MAGAALLGSGIRALAFEGYYVPSPSMEPTLHGDPRAGDRVLVDKLVYRFRAPRRWEVAVFQRPGTREAYIKRVVGLPGDTLWILDGDVYNGSRLVRKPPAVFERVLVPLFTERRLAAFDRFWTVSGGRVWREGSALRVQARAAVVRIRTRDILRDGYELPDGRFIPGEVPIKDFLLSASVQLGVRTGAVGLGLWNTHVEAALEARPGGALTVRVGGRTVWRRALPGGKVLRLGLGHVDGVLYAACGGSGWVAVADTTSLLGGPVPWHRRHRAEVWLKGREARLLGLRLERDLHYTASGRLAVEAPLLLGPRQYFVLGDNSSNSTDSRDWGPVPLQAFIGRPVAVVWPPERWRVFP